MVFGEKSVLYLLIIDLGMEIPESYPASMRTHQLHNNLSLELIARRPLSPEEEKHSLRRKIESLMDKTSLLKEKQETLQNTAFDLRKLLELVGNESLTECSLLHQETACLQKRISGLSNKLHLSHREGDHLQRCSMYWEQFLS